MTKKHPILALLFIGSLVFSTDARADFEVIQPVFNILKQVVQKATVVVKKVQDEVRVLTDKVGGESGNINDIKSGVKKAKKAKKNADKLKKSADKANKIKNRTKLKSNEFPSILTNTADNGKLDETKLGESVQENYVPKFGSGRDTEVFLAKDAEIQAIQRENAAALYARALTFRTNMFEEQQTYEGESEIIASSEDETDERELQQRAAEIELRIIRTMNHITELNSRIAELQATQRTLGQKNISSGGSDE